MNQQLPKRLIEVDLPIKRISAHARREKSIRHGHISTLHIWWARRPLAACRAVTCAALWPDPADENCPAEFRAVAAELMFKWGRDNAARGSEESAPTWTLIRQHTSAYALCNHPSTLRQALLDFIADFSNWDNSTVAEYLETARALTAASHWALNLPVTDEHRESGWPGYELWQEKIKRFIKESLTHPRPLVVDPFAGGGSIPLEVLRIGGDAFASDLNPVPILLNKVILEYIPKYGSRLADEVKKWGSWLKAEAEKELSVFYPKDADGSTPITYLWARTIRCEGPGCGAKVPLIRSQWLAKKSNRSIAVHLVPNARAKKVDFKIITKRNGSWVNQDNPSEVIDRPELDGTVKRGSATCPCCGYTTPVSRVRVQLCEQSGGANDATLFAVVVLTKTATGRAYRVGAASDLDILSKARNRLHELEADNKSGMSLVPDEVLPLMSGVFNAPIYGHSTWGSLFNHRQALSLVILGRLAGEVAKKAGAAGDAELAIATATVLAMAVSKHADMANALCAWEPIAQCPRHLFGRQAIGMIWDYAEGVAIGDSSGSALISIDRTADVLTSLGSDWRIGSIEQASAASHPLPDDSAQAVITDPPYYNAVPYADLSDFFYLWLRRMLKTEFPSLLSGALAPKDDEICEMAGWDPVRYPHKTSSWFEGRMGTAMSEARRFVEPNGIGVVVFAHKSTAGWEAQLQAILQAGWKVTGSWPIDTECGSRLRAIGSAALASSIHIVVRPREAGDGSLKTNDIGDWRDVLDELPKRIHDWMPRLAAEGVVGADAIFACLGPALEIFSRYSRVEKASGEEVTLREYLEHIWAAVSKEALSSLITGSDLSTLESDARITAMWLWTLNSSASGTDGGDDGDGEDAADEEESGGKASAKGGFGLEYDAARKIAQGLGASLEDMKAVVEVKGDQARLLPVAERTAYLFGKDQASAPDQTGRGKKKKAAQMDLFAELTGAEATEAESVWEEKTVSKPGATVLDRVHQSMILFATGRGEALKRFLVEDGIGREGNFWKLAQALSALYPSGSQEKRWVDGVLARKKGLGL